MTDNHVVKPYVDEGAPESNNAPVSRWLLLVYATLPIWGLVTLFFFWNGSTGWFDRGGWKNLQEAANTTYPLLDLTQRTNAIPPTQSTRK